MTYWATDAVYLLCYQLYFQMYNDASDKFINKSLFKDKKLNMLWAKAEASGFTSEELVALKEEFTHHQEKIDQYYDLLVNMEAGEADGYKSKYIVQ